MAEPKPKQRNPALRMLGLPALPKKLPSRNWLIFWAITSTFSAAIIYDRREKKRATARWAHAVSHLAREPAPNASALPRKLTVYLESPPGDGLRVAQDHFADYVKPILASSGLDWEFVVGRQQGDIRAVVAERVRRERKAVEKDVGVQDGGDAAAPQPPTEEEAIAMIRRQNGTPEYEGTKGDIILGRHTWKEYVRGLHEGWLGPLQTPPHALPPPPPPEEEPKEGEETKPKKPPQPKPYNTTDDYPSSSLPRFIPSELGPSITIPFPHILGFLSTPVRMRRFLNRRHLADSIGRDVAAACLASYRTFNDEPISAEGTANPEQLLNPAEPEQLQLLANEEKDWVKSVWAVEEKASPAPKDDAAPTAEGVAKDDALAMPAERPKERIWASPIVLDSRIASRMRRFELQPEEEERARHIVVKEEEIEGWIKRNLRNLWKWSASQFQEEQPKVIVGNLDSDD